jgi:DNA repair exonuclease SbcCD ATPase subunit
MTITPTFPAVVFSVTDAGIAELEAKHRGLVVAHGDKKGYLALTQAIAEVRTARTDVEKRRKELKQDALDYGRLVDSTAKAITERLEAIEGPLKANKEQIDAENERIRKEKEEAERLRIAGIQSLIAAIANAPAAFAAASTERLRQAIEKAWAMEISIADYEEFTQQATDAKTAAISALSDLLTARIAADEAEAARIAEQARIDAERKAEAERLAAEQAALAAERAEFDRQQAEARRQQEEADQIRRETEAAEQAKRDAEARAQQAEMDRQRAELKAAQDALAEQQRKAAEAAQAEADAKARKEAEKAAKAAKAKLDAEIEAARPDREKIINHVRKCIDGIPEVSTEIGGHYAADLREGLEELLLSWNVVAKEAA